MFDINNILNVLAKPTIVYVVFQPIYLYFNCDNSKPSYFCGFIVNIDFILTEVVETMLFYVVY